MADLPQHSDERPAGLLMVEGGKGELLAGGTILSRAAWSDGAVCIIDQELPPGLITPAHRHTDETQGAYIVSGRVGFWVDGEEGTASAGSYVIRPAGSVHSLWNAGDEPAKMLEVTFPGERFQRFVRELTVLNSEQADAAEIEKLAAEYGTFIAPEVTAELCARHGVAPGQVYAPSGD